MEPYYYFPQNLRQRCAERTSIYPISTCCSSSDSSSAHFQEGALPLSSTASITFRVIWTVIFILREASHSAEVEPLQRQNEQKANLVAGFRLQVFDPRSLLKSPNYLQPLLSRSGVRPGTNCSARAGAHLVTGSPVAQGDA